MDDVELTEFLCTALGGIPGWDYQADGSDVGPTRVGVAYGRIPGGMPHRWAGVRVYGTEDDNVRALHTRFAQVRFRGGQNDPTGADKLAHPAFLVLTGLSRVGGISGVSRISMAPLGADENGREERTDNYEITLDNTGAQS